MLKREIRHGPIRIASLRFDQASPVRAGPTSGACQPSWLLGYAHTMKRRGFLLIVFGALAIVLALVMVNHGSSRTICPAIGYAYVGDVELVFPQEPASVAACFGEGCTPVPVAKSPDGKWLVPQTTPYLVPPVSVTSVFVEAADFSGTRVARALPIETEPTGEHPFGPECGGPVRFKPVHVPASLPTGGTTGVGAAPRPGGSASLVQVLGIR